MGLSVDPMRLVRALWKGRWWIVLSAFLGLALGAGYGFLKAETRYEVSLQLIKRFVPMTIQAGVNGEPYKAHQFTNSTLASAAGSESVLERVAQKSNPAVALPVLKQSITVKEDRLTDFVTLTLSGYHSAEATVDLAKLWSEEVVNFTREMQAQESREMRKVMQTQLDNNQAELQGIDQEIVKFNGGEQLLSMDVQVDTFVRMQSEIDSKYDAARLDLEAITSQITSLKTEMQKQTPAAEELRQAKAELEQFRTRLTDQNPLVIERKDKVLALEAELQRQSLAPAGDSGNIANLASTFVGNALYLRMVELENQRSALDRKMHELERQRDLFSKTPEKASQFMELLQKKQMLRTAQSLLLSRLQEVRIFEDHAPAYYGVFAPAELDGVVVRSKMLKLCLFGLAGAVLGVGLSLVVLLVAGTVDRKLWTPGEAAKAVGAPLFGAVPAQCTPKQAGAIGAALWARWLSGGSQRRARVSWCPAENALEGEFWKIMLTRAASLLPSLVVLDCGREPLPAISEAVEKSKDGTLTTIHRPLHEASLADAEELRSLVKSYLEKNVEVWLRIEGAVEEPAASIVRACSSPLVLAGLHNCVTAAFFREQCDLLRHSGAAPCGVVALNDLPIRSRS